MAGPQYDYKAEFGSSYHEARRLEGKGEEWIETIRASKFSDRIGREHRVLEYGVGFGWNLAKIECREKVGFDLTPGLRGVVERKGIRFEQEEAALGRNYYDVVICHHALEHIANPLSCLRKLGAFLQPSGRLLLYVPFERERKYRAFARGNKAHHLFSWTPGSLRALVEAASFSVEMIGLRKFRFDRAAAVVASRLRGGLQMYRLVRAIGLLCLPEFEIELVGRRTVEG